MLKQAPRLSARIGSVSESTTTRISALAQTLRRQGREVINLAVGEPDFATPEPIIAATQKALAEQHTRYGPVPGEPALRSRLAESFQGYDADNILLTNGAKQALFSLCQVLCDPGDEVIIVRPCWVSFTEQVKLAGGRPVLVDAGAGFQLDPERIRRAISIRTRAVLINSPNNPTGAVYTAEAVAETARLAGERELYLIADEAYHAYTFDGRPHVPAGDVAPDRKRVITVRSFSKHYNMTGFRIGYVAADKSIIQALTRLQSHSTGNVCTFAQYGAMAALAMDQSIVHQRRDVLQRRRDAALALTRAIFECVPGQGAFYLFPQVSALLRSGESSADFAARLLRDAGVALVPGEAFHGPGHLRISFGTDEETLQRAFAKIKEAL
ncbi:MAG: pyridoxal phosphate-dependent aminotransferase [Desulfobacteraceae bacterium]|nr:MAG: pyridoxal phosphate-dependent aminotransferase [Desulfobacteraceae bacterium]